MSMYRNEEEAGLRRARREAAGYAMQGEPLQPMRGVAPVTGDGYGPSRSWQPAPVRPSTATESLIETAAGLFMVIRRNGELAAPSVKTLMVIGEWLIDYGDWLTTVRLEELSHTEANAHPDPVPSRWVDDPSGPTANVEGWTQPAPAEVSSPGFSLVVLVACALLVLLGIAFYGYASYLILHTVGLVG